MEKILKILIVDDVQADAELELRKLDRAGCVYVGRRVANEADFRRDLDEFKPDIIFSDFSLSAFDGLLALTIAKTLCPDTPFIFVSATIGEEQAIEALGKGATDYIPKADRARLAMTVARLVQEADERSVRRRVDEVAVQSQKKYESLVNTITGIVWEAELPSFRFTFISEQAERILGYPLRAWLDEPDFWKDHIHPDDRDQAIAYCQQQTSEMRPHQFDYRMLAADGTTVWMRDYVSVIVDNGRPVKLQGVMVDVTEPKQQHRKIARLNRVYSVLSSINATIVRVKNRQELFNETCRIVVADGGYGRATVWRTDEGLEGIMAAASMDADAGPSPQNQSSARKDWPSEQAAIAKALRSRRPVVLNDIGTPANQNFEHTADEFRSLAALPLVVKGTAMAVLTLYASKADFFDRDEMKLLGELAANISFALDHLDKQERLEYLAYYDALTGLPNRALFYDRLGKTLQTATLENKKVVLSLLDLVNFKLINDSLGQSAGNAVIKEFSERLQQLLPSEVTLARIAGDVFALAYTGFDDIVAVSQRLMDKIVDACDPVIQAEGQEVKVFVKLGIAVFPGDGVNTDTLFKNAETALKKAKKSVEASVFFSPEMITQVSESLALRNKLRRAIENEQFVLYLQPIYTIGHRQICGAEALVRWNDPETGLVSPVQFIALLEETGLILELGRWVLAKAVALHSQWRASGLEAPRISVNVSAIQLRHRGFVNEMADAVGNSAIHGLDIEITESVMMEDVASNATKIQSVRDMGLEVAIDDFGTGYSSLSYLSKLPINVLKIDRAFIMNLTDNPNNVALVSMIVSLAHSLKLKIVAEGVETEAQANLLKLLRCDMAQGFLFNRPLPADEFTTLLARPAHTMVN